MVGKRPWELKKRVKKTSHVNSAEFHLFQVKSSNTRPCVTNDHRRNQSWAWCHQRSLLQHIPKRWRSQKTKSKNGRHNLSHCRTQLKHPVKLLFFKRKVTQGRKLPHLFQLLRPPKRMTTECLAPSAAVSSRSRQLSATFQPAGIQLTSPSPHQRRLWCRTKRCSAAFYVGEALIT